MDATKELRWFFKDENKKILDWFNHIEHRTSEQREDVYLDLQTDDIGIKLRENNTEIKHRTNYRARGCLSSKVWGHFENWVKWSIGNKDNDPQLRKIKNGRYSSWIRILKNRYTTQLVNKHQQIVPSAVGEIADSGCQVEYARIKIHGETWYTFGLEWFGIEDLEIEPSLLSKIIGDTRLSIRNSYGYPKFLKEL